MAGEPGKRPSGLTRPHGPAGLMGRPVLITAGLAALAFLLVFLAARAAGPVDSATVALATCGAVLVFALARMFAVVRALSRPDGLAQVGRGVGHFTQAELREEKRRLLRAIKELEFDHGMGKLSTADFDSVIGTYRLRAIEVMRALEGTGELHPELQKLLAAQNPGAPDSTPPAAPEPKPAPATPPPSSAEISSPDLDRTSRICVQCNGPNDNDARFCKHCGISLERAPKPSKRGAAHSSGEIKA